MANLLNDYSPERGNVNDDYVRLLKQYAHQHYLNGKLDVQEDYNPDTGNVIVGLSRSHHYNHSGYDDLVITGLSGLRPRADNTLEINPLISSGSNAINYLCLENIHYHGQLITILYDRDGTHYGKGAGLSIYVNGTRVVDPSPLGRKLVQIDAPTTNPPETHPVNLAINLSKIGFPTPSASINTTPAALYSALDGRVWYFPEMPKYWTTLGSQAAKDWYAVDFGTAKWLSSGKALFLQRQHPIQRSGKLHPPILDRHGLGRYPQCKDNAGRPNRRRREHHHLPAHPHLPPAGRPDQQAEVSHRPRSVEGLLIMKQFPPDACREATPL
jgi:hypothetical protein